MKEKLKWFIREMMNMYSNKESYFSKKRFESSISFLSGVGLILAHAYHNWGSITNSEIIGDSVVLFSISGYQLNAIQKEKLSAGTDVPKTEDNVAESIKTP